MKDLHYTSVIVILLVLWSCGSKNKVNVDGTTEHKVQIEAPLCEKFPDKDDQIECLKSVVKALDEKCGPQDTPDPI